MYRERKMTGKRVDAEVKRMEYLVGCQPRVVVSKSEMSVVNGGAPGACHGAEERLTTDLTVEIINISWPVRVELSHVRRNPSAIYQAPSRRQRD
jgi:hypothetical protein